MSDGAALSDGAAFVTAAVVSGFVVSGFVGDVDATEVGGLDELRQPIGSPDAVIPDVIHHLDRLPDRSLLRPVHVRFFLVQVLLQLLHLRVPRGDLLRHGVEFGGDPVGDVSQVFSLFGFRRVKQGSAFEFGGTVHSEGRCDGCDKTSGAKETAACDPKCRLPRGRSLPIPPANG